MIENHYQQQPPHQHQPPHQQQPPKALSRAELARLSPDERQRFVEGGGIIVERDKGWTEGQWPPPCWR